MEFLIALFLGSISYVGTIWPSRYPVADHHWESNRIWRWRYYNLCKFVVNSNCQLFVLSRQIWIPTDWIWDADIFIRINSTSEQDPHKGIPRWALGSSDFPRSLCFNWFWVLVEILQYMKKTFFIYWMVSFYLIWPFILQKKYHNPIKLLKFYIIEIVRHGF
jgi:hypothetical protein